MESELYVAFRAARLVDTKHEQAHAKKCRYHGEPEYDLKIVGR